MKRVVFFAGLGTGYLLATPSGRSRLAKFKVRTAGVWQDPRAQEYVRKYGGNATKFAKQPGGSLWDKAVDTASGARSESTTKHDKDEIVVASLMGAHDAQPVHR